MSTQGSLVSCLMVTRNRAHLARRAVRCFAEQTWESRELVVIDDGDEDYAPVLAAYGDARPIHYHRVPPEPTRRLGDLRNLALERASGEFCAQWDDDDWYHPDRLSHQMAALEEQRVDAVLLRWTLMHVQHDVLSDHPFRTQLRRGTPGTIVHRHTDVRYPNEARREDSRFRDRLAHAMRIGIMRAPHSHLFIRCFHGANTWPLRHFTERLHRTLPDSIRYLVATYVRRDLYSHPAFRLTADERAAVDRFRRQSRELELLP